MFWTRSKSVVGVDIGSSAVKLVELSTAITGGGLLGGCIALIVDRIKKR